MKKFIMIVAISLFYMAVMAQQPAVDVVTLKNGSVIRGKIIEQTALVIKIYTTNRSMVEVKPEEVESMTKESSSPAEQSSTVYDEDVFKEGNMIIGGSGTLDYLKQKNFVDGNLNSETSSIGLSINPSLAYFIIDGLAVGARVPVSISSSKGDISYSLGIGPLVKYYTDYLVVYKLEAAYEFNHSPSGKGGTFTLKPGVGMAFFLNSKVSLEPGLFYEFYSDTWKTDFSDRKWNTNTIGFEIGLTIFL